MPNDTDTRQEANKRQTPDKRSASQTSNRKHRAKANPRQVYTFPAPPCSTCNMPRYKWHDMIFTPHDRQCIVPRMIHPTPAGMSDYNGRIQEFNRDAEEFGVRKYK